VTWGESPKSTGQTTAAKRIFFVSVADARLQWRVSVGAPSDAPVALYAGLSTLPSARHPRLRARYGI
jgi:hypothetical protein